MHGASPASLRIPYSAGRRRRFDAKRPRLDQAVTDADRPLRVIGDVGIVRHQDDGDPLVLIQLLEHPQHFFAGARIEVAGRLIREEQRRMIDQRPRDRHALLLAPGKLRGLVVHPVAQTHAAQHLLGPLAGFAVGEMLWPV